jgi:hypothetical protein
MAENDEKNYDTYDAVDAFLNDDKLKFTEVIDDLMNKRINNLVSAEHDALSKTYFNSLINTNNETEDENTNEELEQVDEISTELAHSYRGVAKGDRDYNKLNKDYADLNHNKSSNGPKVKALYKKISDNSSRKIEKRNKGIALATKKIGDGHLDN